MATLGPDYYNIADVVRGLRPDESMETAIADVLTKLSPIMKDIPWKEANGIDGHRSTLWASLPTVAWRLLYEGVQPSKAEKRQVTDTTATIDTMLQVDSEALSLNNNSTQWLMGQAKKHLEAIAYGFEENFFQSTVQNNRKFAGLPIRYSTPSTDKGNSGYYMVDGGGTGSDNTSIWMVSWGEENVHGIYPKGSTAGIEIKNFDEEMIADPDGGEYPGYKSHYRLKGGLAVPDPRSVVRICNIDVSDLSEVGEAGYTGASLINLLIKGWHKFPQEKRRGNVVIYANEGMLTALDLYASSINTGAGASVGVRGALNLSRKEIDGEEYVSFRGKPIKGTDFILDTEAAISFS